MKNILCIVALVALFSCSAEKVPEKNTAGGQSGGTGGVAVSTQETGRVSKNRYSLKVFPAEATRSTVLKAVAVGFRGDTAKIEWLLNGGFVAGSGATFDTSSTTKGDRVQARALVDDSEISSDEIEIRNSPPELTRVKIMPEVFKQGDNLYVEAAASDADRDEVTISYAWTRNGEPVSEEREIAVALKRGDEISVKVTPFDGEAYGESALLKREIRNMPPVITEEYSFKVNGRAWSHQVHAADPDGDTLAYSLKAAPSGMKIDTESGLITWEIPHGFRGNASVTAAVKDGHGGEANHTFKVVVNQ